MHARSRLRLRPCLCPRRAASGGSYLFLDAPAPAAFRVLSEDQDAGCAYFNDRSALAPEPFPSAQVRRQANSCSQRVLMPVD